MMTLHKDLSEFVELFRSLNIDFVVVGAFALAHHGLPRTTGDIDLLIRRFPENASRIAEAVARLGFSELGLCAGDFLVESITIQLGRPPNRIDLMTGITGVSEDEVWDSRVRGELAGQPVFFISRDCLLRNKRATGRPKDLGDIGELELIGE